MPIYKSRIRFQGRKKKAKQGDGEKAQRRLIMTVHINDSDSTLVDAEPLFGKKRIPFTEEHDSLLRSNLSTSLAAAKVSTSNFSTAKHNIIISPTTPISLHIKQPQDDDSIQVSFLELAPIYRPISNRPKQTGGYVIDDGQVDEDNEPLLSASFLVTIEALVSVDEDDELAMQLQATTTFQSDGGDLKQADLCIAVDPDEYNSSPSSLLATAGLSMPAGNHNQAAGRTSILTPAAVNDNNLYAPFLVGTQKDFSYIEPILQPPAVAIQHLKHRPTFLQRIVALFAGIRRCPTVGEKSSSTINPAKIQQQWSTTSLNQLPHPPLQQTTKYFDTRSRKPKNPPLPNPVLNVYHPYRPVKEHLDASFIEPAKPNKHTGNYAIASDIFEPVEVHLGFVSPTSPVSSSFATHRPNFASTLLDRDKTTWGNWYAKMSNPENLPFAKVHSVGRNAEQLIEESTEQEAWDAHATSFRQTQEDNSEHKSTIEICQYTEATEQEAAVRLRYHSGHCFGAVTGDVYPFQHGLIL